MCLNAAGPGDWTVLVGSCNVHMQCSLNRIAVPKPDDFLLVIHRHHKHKIVCTDDTTANVSFLTITFKVDDRAPA